MKIETMEKLANNYCDAIKLRRFFSNYEVLADDVKEFLERMDYNPLLIEFILNDIPSFIEEADPSYRKSELDRAKLFVQYGSNPEIKELIFKNCFESVETVETLVKQYLKFHSKEIQGLCRKYPTVDLKKLLQCIDPLVDKEISVLDELIYLYLKDDVKDIIKDQDVEKYRTVDEIKELISVRNSYDKMYHNDIDYIIKDTVVEETRTVDEIKELIDIYVKSNKKGNILHMLTSQFILKYRSIDEIKRLATLIDNAKNKFNYKFIFIEGVEKNATIEEIEWIFNKLENDSKIDDTITRILIYTTKYGKFNLEKVERLIERYQGEGYPGNLRHIFGDILNKEETYKHNSIDAIVSVISYYLDNGKNIKILKLLEDKNIYLTKNEEELYELIRLYDESKCNSFLKEIIFNINIQKRSFSDIVKIAELCKKYDYHYEITSMLSIYEKDIDEYIRYVSNILEVRINLSKVDSMEEVHQYINFIKEKFGSDADIDYNTGIPKLKKEDKYPFNENSFF